MNLHKNILALSVAAAMSMALGGAIAPRGLHTPPQLRFLLGGRGPKRKGTFVGKGRRGNRPGRYVPHQGIQERLRRVIGGWAGRPMTKRETFDKVAGLIARNVPVKVVYDRVRKEEAVPA